MAVTPLVSIIAAVTFAGNLIVHCRSDADRDVASSETSSSDSVCFLASTHGTFLSRGDNLRQTDEELMTNVAGSLSANVAELQQLLHSQEVYEAFDGDLGASYGATSSDSNWRRRQEGVQLAGLQERGRTQACPIGYAFARGDVPGGDHFGRGFNNVMESITHCAGDCNGRPACLSFEYSPTSRNCYLNKEGVPTAVLLGDTVFCTKSTPFELLEKAPNMTNATAAVNAAKPEKERLITFYGRFDKVAGMALWTLIFLVMVFFLISLCWCCCCGLNLFNDGNFENLDNDEDKELHEVWVRNKK